MKDIQYLLQTLKTVLQNCEILSTNRIMRPSGSTMSIRGLALIRYHCMQVCLVHSTHHRHLIKSTQGIIEIAPTFSFSYARYNSLPKGHPLVMC